MRGRLALARIGSSLPLEVPVDGVALHRTAPRSTHRADDNFPVPEEGYEDRIRLFYEDSERKRFEVNVVEREACYATKEGIN